ncbi:nucleoside-binding protein [Glaciihabitans tibetensis]|uniref:Nucleoside-binding protein n=1 Tax=Glaciihabitans tibetensis TaxID=1266600 RepID=A0A2T0VF67_9MICO|nr:nucleoside-binding protein [Glaciihabitans tibetensis]
MGPGRFALGITLEDILSITSRKATLSGLALIGTSALLLAGCAAAPEEDDTAAEGSDFLPCMVSDSGGFDDKSFNQLGFEGLKAASDELGVEPTTVESNAETDFAPNIQSLVDKGCDIIVTVGFALSAATLEAAEANPEVEFALIDDAADADFDGAPDFTNTKPIVFDTSQAAFLAGYAAASYSTTGIVGTFGGMEFPTVTIFMEGYADGVTYYNEQNGTDVQTIGLTTFTGGFEANDTAKTTAANLIEQGADVLLPVGGPIYQSAGAAIVDSGKTVALLGADADVFETDPTYSDLYFTSVLKGISSAVSAVVSDAAAGDFSNEAYIGNLENDGVGLAPFHEFEDLVDPELQATLDDLAEQIIAGDITVESYLNAG